MVIGGVQGVNKYVSALFSLRVVFCMCIKIFNVTIEKREIECLQTGEKKKRGRGTKGKKWKETKEKV